MRDCNGLRSLGFLPHLIEPGCLQVLDLSNCPLLPSQEVGKYLGGESVVQNSLVSLKLSGNSIADSDLCLVLERHAKSLRILDVRRCASLTSAVLERIAGQLILLEKLKLPRYARIGLGSVLRLLATIGSSLTEISLPRHTWEPRVFVSVPYMCPKLKVLSLGSTNINFRWLLLLLRPTQASLHSYHLSNLICSDPMESEAFDYWQTKLDRVFSTLSVSEQERAGARWVRSLTDIDLSQLAWDDEVATEFFPFCENLQTVSFHSCRGSPHPDRDPISALTSSGCRLLSVDVSYASIRPSPRDSPPFASLVTSRLQYLSARSNLENATLLHWLDSDVSSLTQLHSLHAHWADNLRSDSLSRLVERSGKSLRWVSLGLCYFINEPFFTSLSRFSSNLRDLSIESIPCIDDDVISSLCRGCLRLETLNISHNRKVTDEGLAMLSSLEFLSSLKMNNLVNLTDEGLSLFVRTHRGRLKILDIGGNRNFSLLASSSICKHLSHLRELNIGSTRFSIGCLLRMTESLLHLSSLNRAMQPNVSNPLVATLLHLEILTELDLSECPKLTGDMIQDLAKCTSLQSLTLANCTGIGGVTLAPILRMATGPLSIVAPSGSILSRDRFS